MDMQPINMGLNPEQCREKGKFLYYFTESTREERDEGFRLLNNAAKAEDPEAMYIIADLLLSGKAKVSSGDSHERALSLLCKAANCGFLEARGLLNRLCENEYQKNIPSYESNPGPLTDYDGIPIVINRQGAFTPIDAVLNYEDGKNILRLSANIVFLGDDSDISDQNKFRQAVLSGISAWQGDYQVFNGQHLRVEISLTTENRLLDNITVIPMTTALCSSVSNLSDRLGIEKIKTRTDDAISSKRSFAGIGLKKWTVHSRKTILLQSQTGRFDDYEELTAVMKHEFGHALGLGDLYFSPSDGLPGVEKGTYQELDGYYITDRFYNLVMCDHHGIISNNDVEMVVLAFRENRLQSYQPDQFRGKISAALGRGN